MKGWDCLGQNGRPLHACPLLHQIAAEHCRDYLLVVDVDQAGNFSNRGLVILQLISVNHLWDIVFTKKPGQEGLRGHSIAVPVTSATIQDRTGGKLVLAYARRRFARLKLVWADQRYEHGLTEWVKCWCRWMPEIVRPPEGKRGFRILLRRWRVECSITWYTRSRRLSRDYEGRPRTSESWLYLANIRLMLRRLEPTREPS